MNDGRHDAPTQDTYERDQLPEQERHNLDRVEMREWLDSLAYVLASAGPDRVRAVLERLEEAAHVAGVQIPFTAETPYVNTIPAHETPDYPGDFDLERRIRALIRWNAMAMVVRANKYSDGIGGHLATYASAATLYEVGFNHFFRGPAMGVNQDLLYIQGHASPGIYARSYLEGRINVQHMRNFRRELQEHPGLSSYPHPWLMPDYWQFATVSMGLAPIFSIYNARFARYLEARGLKEKGDGKIWAFLGDGETDEPETLGAIKIAAREKLDNLIWVINANLQRLDGPVFGNGKIIQELEAIFRGSGWNVIKVAWGRYWDQLLEKDTEGLLVDRFDRMVDGESQRYAAFGGAELRERFFDTPELKQLIEGWTDDDLDRLNRGGHDPTKVYAAYKRATEHRGQPTVILARTVKGYGLGESAEAKNPAHQTKKLDAEDMKLFRDRFDIPISDEEIGDFPFYRPAPDSPEATYLQARREALGGYLPARSGRPESMPAPEAEGFEEFFEGTGDRAVSSTMVFVSVLRKLLRDPVWGDRIVPIIPDEARTFGMEALFRQIGIYSPTGQLYEPVDKETLLYYKESKDGAILEEGITEAGAMSSFIAAGTSYANYDVTMVPFFIYYSMFGFQRVGDLAWAAGDMRTKGFLLGATAGRTTLAGEGLQHQDGHSHLLALPVPNLEAYDPAFAFELATIIREGMRRMYEQQEDIYYYLTIENENIVQPAAPDHLSRDQLINGILKGLYLYKPAAAKKARGKKATPRVQLFGSGAIMGEVIAAQALLAEYGVAADVWSITSFKALHRDAVAVARRNRLRGKGQPETSYLAEVLAGAEGPFVTATDYVKALPDMLAPYLPKPMISLGTDGFGRSEAREELREHFEVNAAHVAFAALRALVDEGTLDAKVLEEARGKLGIQADKRDPATA